MPGPTGHVSPRPPLAPARQLGNALLLGIVAVPGIFFVRHFVTTCGADAGGTPVPVWDLSALFGSLCAYGVQHPIALLNVVFFVNVTLLFWLIALAQRSTWLIDPYWTLLPVLMGLYFWAHPAQAGDPLRAGVALGLVCVWSVRLTHSYFRREEWRFGWREDWRFAEWRERFPQHWWWMSFFVAFLSQQVMLVGLCLPLYAVNARAPAWNAVDTLATLLCLAGISIAHVADTQLRRFVVANGRRAAAGEPTVPLLDRGLWRHSRHPNYFGEQLWWWSLALYGVNTGVWWCVAGALINSLVLAAVTVMTERRMAQRPERAAPFREYQRSTSVWIPWRRSRGRAGADVAPLRRQP